MLGYILCMHSTECIVDIFLKMCEIMNLIYYSKIIYTSFMKLFRYARIY